MAWRRSCGRCMKTDTSDDSDQPHCREASKSYNTSQSQERISQERVRHRVVKE